jgi:ABC-type molybdenum transport system ATPase subunit/photorepair protein PhrA|tara:strand:+ start:2314 stop:2643 length:330 start_codon:yes stop_codon:yes gene_type:complete
VVNIMGTSSATLELKDIHVRRDDTSVIGRMSYKVEDDQHWGILGANGSGKITLMRIMALSDQLRKELTALEMVMTARDAFVGRATARAPCTNHDERRGAHSARRTFGTT